MKEEKERQRRFEPIAVVGLGALFPGSKDAQGFWDTIVHGKDLVTDVPDDHWLIDDYYDPDPKAVDKTYCKRGAFLDSHNFNPMEYGIPPQTIPALDTSQLLALVVAKEVLGDLSGQQYHKTDLSRISVILGAATLEAIQYVSARMQRPVWKKSLTEFGLPEEKVTQICDRISEHYTPWQESTFPGLLSNVVAGRIANRFNLGGSNCIVDAACAGSLAALSMSLNELQLGTADMVITGGVDTLNDIVMFMCFSKTPALSMTGDCRPFSAKADGTILGEGVGMLALKRLSDAERDGNLIYGVIRGIGTSSDGRSKSIYAPLPEGQSQAILRAYELAGYPTSTVEMIEAHGTGTKAGDLAEINGLGIAFSKHGKKKRKTCALGSIKSQIGHTKSASGAAGLFKALMSLHHKTLPPTLKVEQPNPQFDWDDSPFYLNTKARPWIRNQEHPRRAGVSSFGFGGSNYHVAVEEYQGSFKARRFRTFDSELVVLSADTPQDLLRLCDQALSKSFSQSLSSIAYESQMHSDARFLTRLSIVASSRDDLIQKLNDAIIAIKKSPEAPLFWSKGIYYGHAEAAGKVAFLFPGQGSQYLSMGDDLAMAFSMAIAPWEAAANKEFDGTYLQEVVFPVPGFTQAEKELAEKRLTSTEWAQPALAMMSLSQLKMLESLKIYPDCLAGHSFGEITALHAAKVFDEEALLSIARKRGELMQTMSTEPGAMISVLHSTDIVLELLKKWQLPITPANFNSPSQIVLSGNVTAIDQLEQHLKDEKISYRRLPVMTGFHSSLVAKACQPFANFLDSIDFREPSRPVYANTTAEVYPVSAKKMKNTLANQLANPVQFRKQIDAMYDSGVRTFIEIGPQGILTSLVQQCLVGKPHQAIQCDRKGENGVTRLWHALGHMIAVGLNPQLDVLWSDVVIPVAEKVNENNFSLPINGTNYGKPYPSSQNLPPVQQKHEIKLSLPEKKTMSDNTIHPSIYLYQDLQKQLVDAHNTYQKSMAESHIAFLNSVTQLASNLGGANLAATAQAMPAIKIPSTPIAATPVAQAQPVAAAPTPVARPAVHIQPKAPRVYQAAPVMAEVRVAQPVAQVQTPVAVSAPAVTAGKSTDLKQLLLDVVADKTGYPAEMLNMTMSIEGDLGIDSIKRVEILAALTSHVPQLPEIAPSEIAKLSTLNDIVVYMETQLGQSVSANEKELVH